MTSTSEKSIAGRPPGGGRRRGFTLLELLVVMLLLSLGISLVAGSVGHGLGRQQPKFFVRRLVDLCRQARGQAMTAGRPRAVVIDGEERRCYLENSGTKIRIPAAMRIETEKKLRPAARGDGRYRLWFFPDGSSSGDQLLFSLDEQPFYRLTLDPLTGCLTLRAAGDGGGVRG